jgi:Mrp family chromosome partitioning ATPase
MSDPVDKERSVYSEIIGWEGSGLHFLPRALHQKNNIDGVWNERIDKFLRDCTESYDYIVIDMPPLTFGVEVRIAALTIDTLLLVIKWGSTKTEIIQSAVRSSGKAQLKFIGFMLNGADSKRMREHDDKLSLNDVDLVASSMSRVSTRARSQVAVTFSSWLENVKRYEK